METNQIQQREMERLNWYGVLTIGNIEQVVDMFRRLLTGKRYTFVAVNMYGNEDAPGQLISRPGVRTSQRIEPDKAISKDAFSFWYGDNKEYAGFNVVDTYGVWGCSTSATDSFQVGDYENPYIVFEYHKVLIIHRAPAGHLLYWVIATEAE